LNESCGFGIVLYLTNNFFHTSVSFLKNYTLIISQLCNYCNIFL
jgi:hypothetical protein